MNSLNEKSLQFKEKIKLDFESGKLTLYAELLLYKQ